MRAEYSSWILARDRLLTHVVAKLHVPTALGVPQTFDGGVGGEGLVGSEGGGVGPSEPDSEQEVQPTIRHKIKVTCVRRHQALLNEVPGTTLIII